MRSSLFDGLRDAVLPRALALVVGALAWTWRIERIGRAEVETALKAGPVIFAFLHGDQLPLIATHRDLPAAGMASLSRDGELLARTISALGYAVVRGSSSRGGDQAMAESQAAIERRLSPALAVDGPRGPRGDPKPGSAVLAVRNQIPVAWFRFDARRAIRLRSWDRFCIPWPFTQVRVFSGILSPGRDVAALTDRIRDALAPRSTPPTGS